MPDDEREALTEGGKGLLGGIEMTQKELHTVLTRHGVTAIEAEPGAAFDPNLHQAVANIPSEHPNGTIARNQGDPDANFRVLPSRLPPTPNNNQADTIATNHSSNDKPQFKIPTKPSHAPKD